MATVARMVCDMSWKDYLEDHERGDLALWLDLVDEHVSAAKSYREEIHTLRKRAGKRMERAAEKARKEANDHQQ